LGSEDTRVTHKYDLVIFDLDGTLADTFPWFASVLNTAADRFGFNRVDPEHERLLRDYAPQQILAHLGLPLWKLPMLVRHLRMQMTEQLQNLSLFDGATQMLEGLCAKGVPLALVTSNSETNARKLLGPRAARCFRYFVCGASMFGKASKIKKVLARSQVAAARALLVGDEIRDCDAALASGVAFGAVSWGYNTPAALRARQHAEFFETIDDIQRLFEGE
jgi:phosphoglycolate phosphatase